jgi:hypothetical protein
LQVHNPLDRARNDEPVTSGLPLPRDLGMTEPSQLRLVDAGGNPIPAQFTPLARWGGAPDDPSAPLRWVLVDFQASVGPQDTAYYFLQAGGPGPEPPHALSVNDEAETLTIDTGVARFSVSKADGGLSGPGLGGPSFGRAHSGSTLHSESTYETSGPVTVHVALEGPMRVSVHVRGTYRDERGTPLLDYTSRYWFYAGQPAVRLFYTVENNTPCPLAEYGQPDCYDIGSGGSVTLDDVSLVLPTDLGGSLTYQAAGEGAPVGGDLTDDLLLYQDSSGTAHWDAFPTWTAWATSTLDTRPRMQAYVSFRGYRTTLGTALLDEGRHAAGWLSLTGNDGSWSAGVRDFWQNFPKSLRAAPDGSLEIGLFPGEFGPPDYGFNLRAGEHKTHEIILSPAPAPLPMLPRPLLAQAPPQWVVDSGALGLSALPDLNDWPDHESYVNHQLPTMRIGWTGIPTCPRPSSPPISTACSTMATGRWITRATGWRRSTSSTTPTWACGCNGRGAATRAGSAWPRPPAATSPT